MLTPFRNEFNTLASVLEPAGFSILSPDAVRPPQTIDGATLRHLRPGVLLLTEEAFCPATMEALAAFQAAEPQWSALPVVLLCDEGRSLPPLIDPIQTAHPDIPVTVLRRPVADADLIVAVRNAHRVRAIQERMRDVLAKHEQSEQWARFLLNELNHRTKNMFSMVLALASQTMRQTRNAPDTFMPTFEGRVQTLAKAYAALTRHDWQGATIRDLAENVVLPLAEEDRHGRRVIMEGPSFAVPPTTATTLALAMHELAINARKYGALSTPDATVTLTWQRAGRDWGRLEWRERGGPPVEPPTHKGFGTRVITGAVRSEAGGDAELRFDPEGLTCLLQFQIRPECSDLPTPAS